MVTLTPQVGPFRRNGLPKIPPQGRVNTPNKGGGKVIPFPCLPRERAADYAAWERDCVARARAGDAGAFGDLVERYADRIYTHLVRLVRNREEAEDLTQETFLRAFRFLFRYDATRPFRNWLYTIATNLGLNALRANRRANRSLGAPAALHDEARQRVTHDELAERLADAVSQLPARSASLVHLHYYEEMPIREAAEIVGLSEGAAKVALCRARKRLREWLIEDTEP